MSQQRVSKAPGTKAEAKTRSTVVKASGDSVPCSRPKRNESSPSKNKIPKNVQYDLENALIGLCDVWFREIKPHLIRNNVKLHMPGGAGAGAGAASGDHSAVTRPGCSHHDPGAASDHRHRESVSSAGCCSTRHRTSRMRYHKQQASATPAHLPHQRGSHPTTSKLNDNSTKKPSKRKRGSKKIYKPSPLSSPQEQELRLCRTYSLLCPTISPSVLLRRRTVNSQFPRDDNMIVSCHKKRVRTRNISIQTDPVKITPILDPELVKLYNSIPFTAVQFERCPSSGKFNPLWKYSKDLDTENTRESRGRQRSFHSNQYNIIGEISEKNLDVLYKSPVTDCPSSINYVSINGSTKRNVPKKIPWK